MNTHPLHMPIGSKSPDVCNAVIEIPEGSKVKYEIDKETGVVLTVSRDRLFKCLLTKPKTLCVQECSLWTAYCTPVHTIRTTTDLSRLRCATTAMLWCAFQCGDGLRSAATTSRAQKILFHAKFWTTCSVTCCEGVQISSSPSVRPVTRWTTHINSHNWLGFRSLAVLSPPTSQACLRCDLCTLP